MRRKDEKNEAKSEPGRTAGTFITVKMSKSREQKTEGDWCHRSAPQELLKLHI